MNSMIKTFVATAAFATTLGFGAQQATATTLQLGFGETTCNESQFTVNGNNSIDCAGAFDGNHSNQSLAGLFGVSSWTELVKVDLEKSETSATQNGVTLTATSGNEFEWSISDWGGYSPIMAAVKAGNYFSVYLIDPSLGTLGAGNTFSIIVGNNPNKDNNPDLSNLAIYYGGDPSVIPLPAAGWLLLGGLGGLALLRRRRKTI